MVVHIEYRKRSEIHARSVFNRFAPVFTEVYPSGSGFFDESKLLFATPRLQLLFPGDGAARGHELLVPDEPVASIVRCEPGERAALALVHSALDVTGDSSVENAGAAGSDVGVIEVAGHGARVRGSRGVVVMPEVTVAGVRFEKAGPSVPSEAKDASLDGRDDIDKNRMVKEKPRGMRGF